MESAPSSAWTNGAADTSPRPTTDPPGYINTNKHPAFGVAGSCWIPILLPGDAAERSLSKQSSPGLSIFSRNMFVTKTNCSINRNGNRKAEQAGGGGSCAPIHAVDFLSSREIRYHGPCRIVIMLMAICCVGN